MKACTKILKTIIKTLETKSFCKKHIENEKCFIRNRKITFSTAIKFVLGNLKTTLPTEIYNYSKQAKVEEFSAAAMSKARDKIKYTVFEELLEITNECIGKEKLYKGYELLAVDGMKGELPKTKDLMKSTGQSKTGKYPLFHSLATYDVLNNYYLNAIFNIGSGNERELARASLEKTVNENKQIYIYDRGFPEVALIKKLNEYGKNYVIRVSKSFLKEVNNFTESKAVDKTITITYDKRRGQTNEAKDTIFPYTFSLRMVRIKLKNGNDEILITNLPNKEFSKRNLTEIYKLRWGIESSFNQLKHAVVVEDFISKKENTIKQEFYATLILYNIIMCYLYDTKCQKTIKKKQNF